ncbi:thiol-activated cytolysin family protein [Winogradskyella immobilis]|uniref:Thiol-activated cytolysin family protein n=1 Tax=Winogradskyella immobilis TaxID=2816852 RepID=A0ABS8EL36_9FLAO|nr:thiol-activated cytolysin family protein [Winogradskyella immobilis]MCC1483641.1 thiol-activated cytolysin family protein [Winogradskyella immobilis]MCG0015735.1 thiol-activated cytolysin family protein [Winogradskyella immobilis]
MKPQSKTQFRLVITLCIMLILNYSCSDSDEATDPDIPDLNTFQDVINNGGEFEDFPQGRSEEITNDEVSVENQDFDREDENDNTITERFICTTQTVSVTAGNGTFPLFNPNAEIVYPGNLLQGATLNDATPRPIPVRRAGGTISYNINDGNPNSSFRVDEVSRSSIQNGINSIIANATGATPANFQLDIIQIESEQQLALEMGIDINTYTTQVAADLSLNQESSFNSTLVRLTQQYYTMSFDLPTSLDEIFDESVTPEQLSTFVQNDNPAAFISSVTYGRIFYMLIESTSSREEMSAQLNLAYESFGNSVEGEIAVDQTEALDNLSIKVIAYGGDSRGAFELAGETNIQTIANNLAESVDIRQGLPLSYVVRSVERPDIIVGTNISTEYDIVNCELRGILPPQGYLSLVDLFANDEDGGGIGAMLHVAESNVLVFNKLGTRYAWFNGNSGEIKRVFGIKDPNSPLGEVPLDDVGAAIQLGDTRLFLFDESGLLVSIMEYDISDPALTTNGDAPTTPIGNYQLDTNGTPIIDTTNRLFGSFANFQFAGRGFGAGARVGAETFAFFESTGNEYALFINSESSGIRWENPLASSTWFDDRPNEGGRMIFDEVGAISFINLGGSNGRWLIVNESGNEIFEYRSTPTRALEGPWIIN